MRRLARNLAPAVATLAAALVGAYAAEGWITWQHARAIAPPQKQGGAEPPNPLAKIRALRAEGRQVYPAMPPEQVAHYLIAEYPDLFVADGEPLAPLASVPEADILYCFGDPGWLVYPSDEYGFNNPRGIWGTGTIEIAAVGDSFTNPCIEPEHNILGYIRARVPATLNLGQVGNGPLIELASLREYLPAVKPRTVLWLFFDGNDLENLATEKSIPAFARYLDPGYRRDLPGRSAELSRILKEMTEREIARASRGKTRDNLVAERAWSLTGFLSHDTERFLILANLRGALGLTRAQTQQRGTLDTLEQILRLANTEAAAWGGTLHFVYLPSYETARYRHPRMMDIHDGVIARARAAGRPVIDMLPQFAQAPALEPLFDSVLGHYGAAGYKLVADEIMEAVRGRAAR